MKLILVALALASIVFATDDAGCTENTAIGTSPEYRADFNLTLINNWPVEGQLLGMDYLPDENKIIGNNREVHKLYLYSPMNGSVGSSSISLDASNPFSFGVSCNWAAKDSVLYTNDWGQATLFKTTDGSTWTTVANPAQKSGRGMDFDGTNYWSTQSRPTIGLWRFNPGVGQSFITTPEITTQASGLTAFPYNNNIGIAVTTYNTFLIYFYEWDGSTLRYLGAGSHPIDDIKSACGLTYNSSNDHFYMSYKSDQGAYRLTELALKSNSLKPSTWGMIKASF